MATWLLIHSPLVGAATWAPVASELRRRGDLVGVPDLSPALRADGEHASVQAELVVATARSAAAAAAAAAALSADAGACPDPQPVVLVAHSGAGPLLPVIAHHLAAAGIVVATSVFVDAGLPHPGLARIDTLPTPLAEQLRDLTVDGWLSPWTSWWSAEELCELVPDVALRETLIADCPRLPISLFQQPLPDASDIALGQRCYLRLSASYDDYADRAEERGWPVTRIPGHHLSLLTSPTELADAMLALVTPTGR